MTRFRWLLVSVVASPWMLASVDARAQASGQDVATAQALFDDGKALMKQGKYAEACPKLVESQRLDPGGGTLLAIALCHEGEGKTATAWADFNLVLTDARKNRRADREAAALEHIKSLEQKLSRVKITVTTKRPDFEVRRDGALVGEPQWSTALPVDPGEHKFEARASGAKPWQQTVMVKGEGQVIEIVVPTLEDVPPPPPEPTPGVLPPAPTVTPVMVEPKERGGNRLFGVAAVVGGLGLVSLGLGAGFGLSASSKWHDAEEACPGGRCTDPSKFGKGQDAGKEADIATAFFIGGAAAVAAAGVLFVVGQGDSSSKSNALRVSPMVGAGTAGLAVKGSL